MEDPRGGGEAEHAAVEGPSGISSSASAGSRTPRSPWSRWVADGAPEGDPRDLPPARQFSPGALGGKPDLVLRSDQPFTVPARSGDIYSLALQGQTPAEKLELRLPVTQLA